MFHLRKVLSPFVALLILILLTTTITLKHWSVATSAYGAPSPQIHNSGAQIDRTVPPVTQPQPPPQPYSSSYLLFTDQEVTRFGEFIWFFSGDSMNGPIRTNHDLGLHPGIYSFNGSRVIIGGNLLGWSGPLPANIVIHAPTTTFPQRAENLRLAAATGQGHWLNTNNQTYVYGLYFHNSVADVYRWVTGTPNPPYGTGTPLVNISIPPLSEYAIYCDGELWIGGAVHGQLGVGAAGTIRIMDNIVYSQTTAPHYRPDTTTTDMLTVVSEAAMPDNTNTQPTGIIIANTWANGRDHCAQGSDVAIDAHLIALNSSFTFEQQNDTWDAYRAPDSLANDERGYIYLSGSIAQKIRGYVHRANHGGTGYMKSYQYDPRFNPAVVAHPAVAPFAFPVAQERWVVPEAPKR